MLVALRGAALGLLVDMFDTGVDEREITGVLVGVADRLLWSDSSIRHCAGSEFRLVIPMTRSAHSDRCPASDALEALLPQVFLRLRPTRVAAVHGVAAADSGPLLVGVWAGDQPEERATQRAVTEMRFLVASSIK